MSTINCTPIKPQVNFGNIDTKHQKQYAEFVKKAMAIQDAYEAEKAEKEQKTLIGSLIAIGTAAVVTYAGGKIAAAKFESAFSNQASKLNKLLNKGGQRITEKTAELLQGKSGKIYSAINKVSNKVAKQISGDKALVNTVGLISLSTLFPKIVTIDGNKDGIADITQKQVSAYKSLIDNMGTVSELKQAMS